MATPKLYMDQYKWSDIAIVCVSYCFVISCIPFCQQGGNNSIRIEVANVHCIKTVYQ